MSNEEFLKAVGSKIRKQRHGMRLSMEKLAGKSNITITAMCKIENGRSNFHILNLVEIAKTLQIDLKDLL